MHLMFSLALPEIFSLFFSLINLLLSGSDGVFDINSTSGCITLTTYPSLLKNELYEIKVKVKDLVTLRLFGSHAHTHTPAPECVLILKPKASEVGGSGQLPDYDFTTVTVRVVDLNNHPPTFYGENGPQSKFEVTMYEHPPAGEILRGFKITVNDSDQVGHSFTFKFGFSHRWDLPEILVGKLLHK